MTTILQLNRDDLFALVKSMQPDELLTKKQAAKLINASEDTIDKFVNDGLLLPEVDQRSGVIRPLVRYRRSEVLGCFGKIRKL